MMKSNSKRIRFNNFIKFSLLFLIMILSSTVTKPLMSRSIDPLSQITLNAYEYHIVSVNATISQFLSGDWDATPTDLSLSAFLVFIVDSENLAIWLAEDNLTQAVSRIPSSNLIYLYDPLFRIDDILLDNRRSDGFQIRVPYEDTWNLVLYAGATLIPLTFSWHINAFDSYILNIILYSVFGLVGIAIIITLVVRTIRKKKYTPEDEIESLLKEQEKLKTNQGLGNLEDFDDNMTDEILEK
ncbi:MAG: hypothetical protein ACTSXA_07075 [Candidatus Heimdallarchaeota archaeon]